MKKDTSTTDPTEKRVRLSEFTPDNQNFNKHTVLGMKLMKKSVETVGVIEAIGASADNVIFTGDARKKTFLEVFGDVEPHVVDIDGTRPVVLRRTDIHSGTKKFHECALLANTTAKKNISLDTDLIQEIAVEEFDIDIAELGVEIIGVDYSEIDGLSENSLREQINSTGQIQLTFLFEPEHREVIDKYMERYGKKTLQGEILKIMQNA